MALSRLVGGWIAVFVWLLLWELVGSRLANIRGNGKLHRARRHSGEALLLLVFGLVGALREWPVSRGRRPERSDRISIGVSLLRVIRTVGAGALLAWRLAPA